MKFVLAVIFAVSCVSCANLNLLDLGPDLSCAPSDISCNPWAWLLVAQVPPAIGTVGALYGGASNWNDYVLRDGSTFVSASGAACSVAGNGYGTCLHSGEIRSAELKGVAACGDFVLSDSLNALNWHCDIANGVARAVSSGLKPGVPLSTLIDFDTASFRPMRLIATTTSVVPISSSSPSTVWWNNPLVVDNDGIGPGTASSGTIYLVTQNTNALYTLDVNNVGLVMRPGALMAGTAAGGENTIQVTGANHVWVEASVDLNGDNTAVGLSGASFSVLRNVRARTCTTAGSVVLLTGTSRSNYLSDIRLADFNNCVGVQIDTNSAYNLFERLILSNSGSNQIRLQSGSQRNTFVDVVAFATGGNNIGNIIVADTAVLNATLAAAGSRGFTGTGAGDRLLLQNVATLNNTFHGIELNGPSNDTVVNLASAHHAQNGVEINTSNNNSFRGLLKVGNNTLAACNVIGGTSPGIITTTCTDSGADGSNTYTGQNSDAVLRTGLNLSSVFIGPISTDDSQNTDDLSGARAFSSITNWFDFQNARRGWAADTSSVTNAALRTQCFAGGTCRIYDWSLSAADTNLRNVNPIVTSGGTASHTFTDGYTANFLKFAVELTGDGYGNENGFCESHERCLYSPNIGAYQGHGDLVFLGVVSSDSVSNVTLYQYSTNGR